MNLVTVASDLSRKVEGLQFTDPITHVYNPLQYARAAYVDYVERYGTGRKEAVFLGMNPGPWGMAQTGVPFGEVHAVRGWLGIEAHVGQPTHLHPKRPIHGFNCTRSEVSGKRVWGWARSVFHTPERFFRRFFIANYCPLLFFEATGANRTPDKIRQTERRPLLAVCDRALLQTVTLLEPAFVIAFGRFAEARARRALEATDVHVASIPHPSPANPQSNRGWEQLATGTLSQLGIDL